MRPRTRSAVVALLRKPSACIALAALGGVTLGIPIITDLEWLGAGISTPVYPDFLGLLAPGGDFEGSFIGGR